MTRTFLHGMAARSWFLVLGLLLATLCGCSERVTMVVVRLQTDLTADQFSNLVVHVREPDGQDLSTFTIPAAVIDARRQELGRDGFIPIHRIGVRPREDLARRFEVQADIIVAGQLQVPNTRVISSYVSEEIVVLDLYISSLCIDVVCEPQLTCGIDGTCIDPYIPPSQLPVYSDDAGTDDPRNRDAGMPSDASTEPDDGSVDGGPEDAGPEDGSTSRTFGAPTLLYPPLGHRSLSPRIMVEADPRATSLEIEFSDACGAFDADCPFDTGVQRRTVPTAGETLVTAESLGLTLPTVAPVGARLHWRVRQCDGACDASPWSDVRYLDAGRVRCDTDGNGRSEIPVGYDDSSDGRAWIVRPGTSRTIASDSIRQTGAATACVDFDADGDSVLVFTGQGGLRIALDPSGATTVVNAALAFRHATSGDFDGDGYEDLAVGRHIYWGSNAGIDTNPFVLSMAATSSLGASDVDGDGVVELLVGHGPSGRVMIMNLDNREAATSPDLSVSGELFGSSVTGLDDFDGDGIGDLAVGATEADANTGAVYIYRGVRGGPPELLTQRGRLADSTALNFGHALADKGDADTQGSSTLLIGHPYHETGSSVPHEGAVVMIRQGDSGIEEDRWQHAPALRDQHFGWSLAGGVDVDGDGAYDLVATTGWCLTVHWNLSDGTNTTDRLDPSAISGSECRGYRGLAAPGGFTSASP